MGWDHFIKQQTACQYFNKLQLFLDKRHKQGNIIYPAQHNRFRAFYLTLLENIKVVIVGQDPYHGAHQADGLSFSVANNVNIPPSLLNVYKELSTSIDGFITPETGSLEHWAKQGVLLLNSVLTVEHAMPGSHANKGWEIFTDNVIKEIDKNCDGVIFLLWGNYAQKKGSIIDRDKHHVLTSYHPSPLSAYRGFFGCGHFKKTNEILVRSNKLPIKW
ncbi:MAG: uracil-DNA glycosylase [Psychromonas sp.]|nr:uracil-DNA glycosylase [Psychromonas sp.]